MLEELRLYPRPPAGRPEGWRVTGEMATDAGSSAPSLSTGFPERSRLGSTGVWTPSCSATTANAQAGRRWV